VADGDDYDNTWLSDLQEARPKAAKTHWSDSWLTTDRGKEASGVGFPSLIIRAKVRIYFNRHQDAPRVWCLSDVGRRWEIQLEHILIDGAQVESVYEPLVPSRRDHDGPPSAYQETTHEVQVEVTEGRAVVRPLPIEPKEQP